MSLLESEKAIIGKLLQNLLRYDAKNTRQWGYYDGEIDIKNIGIAIPHALQNVEAILGWPEIVVDSLAERLEWRGWRSAHDTTELSQVFSDNQLDVEVAKAILDSLVTGVGFLAATAGDPDKGEPPVLVTAIPPTQATYEWDARLNRMSSGYVRRIDEKGEILETLYLPDVTITRQTDTDGRQHVGRTEHHQGRCSLIALPNRARSGQYRGRSEITPVVRYYTDHGVRTILGMEYNREIYTTPQKWIKNVWPEDLGLSEQPSKNELAEYGWQAAMNKALLIPPGGSEDSEAIQTPDVGQFTAASPAPYIDQLRMLAQLVAAQAGVPVTYLGFVHDNPPSADAIRGQEARLVKRAELRQSSFGQALCQDLAYVCQSIVDGKPADKAFISSLTSIWRDASMLTLAVTMDAMFKAVQAGIVPAHSKVVWDRTGFSEAEQEIMLRELQQQHASMALAGLAQAATAISDSAVGLAKANREVKDQ
ncbi:Phage portal protein, SPP1 Gp6 [Corynebacterium kutscheri]|uniref:Phage portal protein, SPP1 Gp6 n=1 Tax=Corynebacterium kutscheri TaxID=35755 RepID=A0A0F6TDN9_9CORY|nr:phage portal protein [Corynebacterium kutscheri]AKE41099.1 Phage portal protein, SPP1 Gp6 [Corynebacterium kutscheri]VEH09417.1 gene 14 protein [Corynebacterium kutscheri]